MTPDEFEERMVTIFETIDDNAEAINTAVHLMVDLLEELGYADGLDVLLSETSLEIFKDGK